MSFEEAIQHSYNREKDSVLIRDSDDRAHCEEVFVPKKVMEKLFAKAHEFSSEPGEVADLCKRCINSVYADRKKQVSHWTWSKEKKEEHRTNETLESVDRLILLTMTHLQKTEHAVYLYGKAETIQKGGFDSEKTKECYEALIKLREVLALPPEQLKKVYSSEAKIAATEAKRMLTSLSVEHKALMRDSVLYDIKQLKKFHKELKP